MHLSNVQSQLLLGSLYASKTCCNAGVIGVAVTGVMLNTAPSNVQSSGWFQAFATCAVQCIVGSIVFVLFARGSRLFGNDPDS